MEELDLFDNAIDSLQHGIEHLHGYSDTLSIRDAKQAIMNLINSLDLMVLECLRRIDEDAIYVQKEEGEDDFGYRATIKASLAYKKIRNHLGRPIEGEEQKAYEILKILRNSAIHYRFVFGAERMENIEFLLHYIARFLEEDLDEELIELISEESYRVYLSFIEGKQYGDILHDRAEEARKEFLRAEINWRKYSSVKDGGTSPVMEWECDECGEYGVSDDEELGEIGTCVFCHAQHKIDVCYRCEKVMNLNYEGPEFCEVCEEWIDEQ